MSVAMNDVARASLERLLPIAANDTGQSRRVASFLLAWWNPQECGRFDFLDMWACGYGPQFEAIVRAWRPELVKGVKRAKR